MTALLHALANLARLRWLGVAFCALAIVCTTANVNANAIASGTQHEQEKTRVGGFHQNSPLNVCANALASTETHRGISSAQRETASAFSHAAEGGEAMTTLYRGVMPAELESIEQTGQFLNLGSAEGKYFSMTAEGVSSYVKQAVMGFGDPPYTMVQTQIPTRLLSPEMMSTVDRGIPAVVVPDYLLPNMTPSIMPYMVVPQ